MSHFFQQVGKVFSKVWDFIRPVVEVVAIAVAVYFTAGLALSAFPATAGFAAAMPGFASAGGIAGQGVFSTLATNIGLGSGLASGAAADTAAAGLATAGAGAGAAGAEVGGATTFAAPEATATAAGATGGTAATGLASTPLAAVPTTAALPAESLATTGAVAGGSSGGSFLGGLASKLIGSSLTDKLLLASVGTNLISGLTSPSPADIQAAKEGFYGSFYGMNANGQTAANPNLSVGPVSEPSRNEQPVPGINIPGTQAPAATPAQPGFQGVQKAQLIPTVASGASAPSPGSQATQSANAASMQVPGTTPLATPRLIPNNQGT